MANNKYFLITSLLLLVGAVLTTTASFSFGVAWLMPILGASVIYPWFFLQVCRHRYLQALGWVLLWAFFQSLAVILSTIFAPVRGAKVILNGTIYTEEMLHWIRTGEGAEGSLSLFLPLHLQEYVLFSLLSLLSLGAVALLLGTYLLNYMNFYVGNLILISANPWLAALLGWPMWSLLRVVGFICTGIALTALGLNFLSRFRQQSTQLESPFPRNYLIAGFGFVIADILVKATLAPIWQKLLLIALLKEAI